MRRKITVALLALLLAFGGLTACGDTEVQTPDGEVEVEDDD